MTSSNNGTFASAIIFGIFWVFYLKQTKKADIGKIKSRNG
jgi:hypothetical protein